MEKEPYLSEDGFTLFDLGTNLIFSSWRQDPKTGRAFIYTKDPETGEVKKHYMRQPIKGDQ